MHVGIITPAPIAASETFIQAHLRHLPGRVTHVHRAEGRYCLGGHVLDQLPGSLHETLGERVITLLPYMLAVRARPGLAQPASDTELLAGFLQQQDVDVVLGEYGTTAADVVPACRSAGIPLVAHFHGFDVSRHKTLEKYADDYRELFAYASAIVAVSEAMAGALSELGCPENKVQVIPYGPDTSFFDLEPSWPQMLTLVLRFIINHLSGDPDETEVEPNP